MNFINTLPCQVDVTLTTEKDSFSIVINASSYHLEQNLAGHETFHVKAELTNPICGPFNFTESSWINDIEGEDGKVSGCLHNKNYG